MEDDEACPAARGAQTAMSRRDEVTIVVRINTASYRALVRHCERLDVQAHELITRIVDRAVESGQPPRPRRLCVTEAHLARIAMLNAEGHSDNAIARELGLSQPTVSKHRARLGLSSRHHRIGDTVGELPA